jgi:hypothetical protein
VIAALGVVVAVTDIFSLVLVRLLLSPSPPLLTVVTTTSVLLYSYLLFLQLLWLLSLVLTAM